MFDAHADDPEFGYRYLAAEAEIADEPMAVRTAWWLCSHNSCFLAFGKARAKNGKRPRSPVHDDLCVVTDADGCTRHEFRADEGKLYLCAIKDACSARIVGYSFGA